MIKSLFNFFKPVPNNHAYLPHIDGLRAIAVLIVVLFHAFPHSLRGGFIGVDVFFVISGYLISSILFKEIHSGKYSIKKFYERRINRIFPALILVIITCIFASQVFMFKEERIDLYRSILYASAFLANIFFYQQTDYFSGNAEDNPLLHFWSLGVEEQFYILWPLLLVYLAFKASKRISTYIFITILISFCCNLYLTYSNRNAAFYLPLGRFWELAVGALFAAIEIWHIEKLTPLKKHSNLLVLGGVSLIAFGVLCIDPSKSFPGFYALIPTIATSLILVFGKDAWIGKYFLSNKVAVFFGLISYPLYLWHWPILSLLHLQEGVAPKEARMLAVGLSILLAAITYFLVEKPIRFYIKSSQKPWYLLFTLILICLFVGSNIIVLKKSAVTSTDEFIFYYKNYVTTANYLKNNRLDCGYLDTNGTLRNGIPNDCYQSNKKNIVMLWGDSHAYQYYYGLKQTLSPEYDLLQIASSGCAPAIPELSRTSKECKSANQSALEAISKVSPRTILLAQRMGHEDVDWNKLSDILKKKYGVENVILIGPIPQWSQHLYRYYAKTHSPSDLSKLKPNEYLAQNLNQQILAMDRFLSNKYKESMSVSYLSPTQLLCIDRKACLVTIEGKNKTELTTFDYGHATLSNSIFIAKNLIKPKLLLLEK